MGASRTIRMTWYMFSGLDLYYPGPAQQIIATGTRDDLDRP